MPISGTKIRIERDRAGLSQSGLANKCGISSQAISEAERDVCDIGIKRGEKIAAALGVPLSAIYDEPVAAQPEPNGSAR